MSIPVTLVKESVLDGFRWTRYQIGSNFPATVDSDLVHLERTMDWIHCAIENGKGGVSSHYSLLTSKWLAPFPETTGYIVPTLFDYARFSGHAHSAELAIRLTDWLADVLTEDGGCMAGVYQNGGERKRPVVFNTGQNLLGFLRTYEETRDARYLAQAEKAGDFLVRSADENGIWDKNLLRGLRHTINARCCWALLLLDRLIPYRKYAWVANQNLRWVQAQQTETGWFDHGSSRDGVLPNTHFIAYTCRGLIESHRVADNVSYLETARKAADRLLSIFNETGTLYAFWDRNWSNRGKYLRATKGRYLCLTGNIQMSLVWMKLYEEYGDQSYRDSAFRMLNQVKALQSLSSDDPGVRGGVKGSFPVFGGYSGFRYPNWAAKFFADALMLKIKIQDSE